MRFDRQILLKSPPWPYWLDPHPPLVRCSYLLHTPLVWYLTSHRIVGYCSSDSKQKDLNNPCRAHFCSIRYRGSVVQLFQNIKQNPAPRRETNKFPVLLGAKRSPTVKLLNTKPYADVLNIQNLLSPHVCRFFESFRYYTSAMYRPTSQGANITRMKARVFIKRVLFDKLQIARSLDVVLR